MTVLELAIFIATFRALQPIGVDRLSEILGGWFECLITPEDVTSAATNMIGQGWLAMVGGGVIATQDGRSAARRLTNGIIRMLDQGTRLLDVALMMAVLRLTKGELDDDCF
jgi:hypothetical protein